VNGRQEGSSLYIGTSRTNQMAGSRYLVESYTLANVRLIVLVKDDDVFYGDLTLFADKMNDSE